MHFLNLNEFLHEPVEDTAAMSYDFWRGHNRFYTAGDLSSWLRNSGFSVIDIQYHEVCYNAFLDDYFNRPYESMPKWRADILARMPAYRNEIILVAEKPT